MGPCRLSPLPRCWPVSLPRAIRPPPHPPTTMVHSPSLPPRRWTILRWRCHPVLPKYILYVVRCTQSLYISRLPTCQITNDRIICSFFRIDGNLCFISDNTIPYTNRS